MRPISLTLVMIISAEFCLASPKDLNPEVRAPRLYTTFGTGQIFAIHAPVYSEERLLKEYGVTPMEYLSLHAQGFTDNYIRNLAHCSNFVRTVWRDFMPSPMPRYVGLNSDSSSK